jgi:O-succinylbenzoate synthase
MRLDAIELRLVDPGFRQVIGTSAGDHRSRLLAYVRVIGEGAEGWGECAALPQGTSVDPPLEVVWANLLRLGAPRLIEATVARGGELPAASMVASLYGTSPVDRMMAATVEMAVMDAELRLAGTPLWLHLGVAPMAAAQGAAVGELVGIPDTRSLDALLTSLDQAVQRSARIRLKVAPGWDVEPVRAVRAAWPTLALQVDANGAYRLGTDGPDDALGLVDLDPFGLACVEQPLAPADLPGHAQLAGILDTPICLDESLSTERRLVDALRIGACRVACLKPGRLGGLLAAKRAQERCLDAGVGAFVGGFFETGLARSASAALSMLPGFTLAGDLSDPAGYLEVDPSPYPAVRDGRVSLSAEPGVGPSPVPELLGRFTVQFETMR